MKEWFVVQTHYNLEDLALNNIKKSGFEVYCPKYLKTITHARQTKKVLKPLFPSGGGFSTSADKIHLENAIRPQSENRHTGVLVE